MKKLLFASLLTSVSCFSQIEGVRSRISIEATQDFGTLYSNNENYQRTDYKLNLAGTGIRISGSILVGGDMYLEPFLASNVLKGESNNLTHTHYDESWIADMSKINSSFSREMLSGRSSSSSTYSANFGLLLMKPVSRFFSVGGGFQGSFRSTHYTNTDTYILAGMTYTNIWEEDLNGFVFSIPIFCRAYVPIAENHFISLFAGMNINQNNPWLSSGIGYSFQVH